VLRVVIPPAVILSIILSTHIGELREVLNVVVYVFQTLKHNRTAHQVSQAAAVPLVGAHELLDGASRVLDGAAMHLKVDLSLSVVLLVTLLLEGAKRIHDLVVEGRHAHGCLRHERSDRGDMLPHLAGAHVAPRVPPQTREQARQDVCLSYGGAVLLRQQVLYGTAVLVQLAD
jgi:hypothetical protein